MADKDSAAQPNSVNLLLIGKTGNGKSALGNTLLGKDCFPENSGTSCIPQGIKRATGKSNGTNFEIVECFGIGDSERDEVERIEQLYEWLNEVMDKNAIEYDAFVLVLKYGGRFTDAEKKALTLLKLTFGEDFLGNHCVVVMTCGDSFKQKNGKSGKTFEKWCEEQEGDIQDVIRECKGRIVLFDNNADGNEKESQIDQLLSVIKNMGDNKYTSAHFQRAAKPREMALAMAGKQKLEAEVKKQSLQIIEERNQEIQDIVEGKITSMTRHQKQCSQCDDLIRQIQVCDRSTGVMNDLEKQVCDLRRFLENTQIYGQRNDASKTELEKMSNDFDEGFQVIVGEEKSISDLQTMLHSERQTRHNSVLRREESKASLSGIQERLKSSTDLTEIKQCFEEGMNKMETLFLEQEKKQQEIYLLLNKMGAMLQDVSNTLVPMKEETAEIRRKFLDQEQKQQEMQPRFEEGMKEMRAMLQEGSNKKLEGDRKPSISERKSSFPQPSSKQTATLISTKHSEPKGAAKTTTSNKRLMYRSKRDST